MVSPFFFMALDFIDIGLKLVQINPYPPLPLRFEPMTKRIGILCHRFEGKTKWYYT
jgi:hypothetical protein